MSVAAIVLCVVAVVLGFLVIRRVVSALWNYIMILLGIAIAIFCLVATISGFIPAILGIVFGLALAGTAFGYVRGKPSSRSSSHYTSSSSSSYDEPTEGAVHNLILCFDVFAGLGGGTVYYDHGYVSRSSKTIEVSFYINGIWGITTESELKELVNNALNEVASKVQDEWPHYSVKTKCTGVRQ